MAESNSQVASSLLYYREDWVNFVRGLTALPIALLPLVTGLPQSGWAFLYALLIWFLLSDINFLLHQHVHHPVSRLRWLNRFLDLAMGLATGMSASGWRQHHLLRHHKGDDAWTYARNWEVRRFSFLGALTYSIRFALMVFWGPLLESFHKGFLERKSESRDWRAAFAENLVVASFVVFLVYALPLFYFPYFAMVYLFTTWTDYENHVACQMDSEYGFANNVIDPIYNKVRDNFGYHTAHHYFPGAHWTTLPQLHETLAKKIPATCFCNKSWNGILTPPLLMLKVFKLFHK